MALNLRSSIYAEIADQFPDVYKENGDFLISFVEAYYEHLDEKMDRDVPKLRDIDSTLSSFIVFFKKKYLADLPLDAAIDVRYVLKHIKDMYTRKGTQESLELLFKIFFDQDIEVFYPSTSILRPSDSIWGGDAYLEMRTVFQVDDYPINKGDRIKGDLSQAGAFVDEVIFVNFSGALSPIIYLSNITGTFSADDGIIVFSADGETNVGKLISGSVSEVNINPLNRIANQKVGDAVSLRSALTGIDGTARVLTTSQQETGSIDFRILDDGFGYIDPTSTSMTVSNKIGISNQVLIVNNANTLQLKPGDIISASSSPLTYTGSGDADAVPYVMSGHAKVIQYNHPLLFVESSNIDDYNTLWSTQVSNGIPNTGLLTQIISSIAIFGGASGFSDPTIYAPYENWASALSDPFPVAGETNSAVDLDDSGAVDHIDIGFISNMNQQAETDGDTSGLSYSVYGTPTDFNYDAFGGATPEATEAVKLQAKRWLRALTLVDFYTPLTAVTTQPTPNVDNLQGYLATGVAFPTALQNPSFTVEVNHNSSNTVDIVGLGTPNDTAKFDIGNVRNKETVTLITDQIGDFTDVVLDADGNPSNDDYGMTGPNAENLNTSIADAFSPITITIGSLDTLNVSDAGSNYQNDVFANIEFDLISKFQKHDFILNFDVVDFNLSVGDTIIQNRTIPDIEVGLTGNLSEAEIENLAATSTNGAVGYQDSVTSFDYISGGTIAYESKAKFLKRVGSDFYFRPMSFYQFDESRDDADVLLTKVLVGGILKSFSGLREDLTSSVMGNNGRVQGVASYQTGQIDTVAITKTGYRYTDGEAVEIFNEEVGSPSYGKKIADATIRALGQGKTAGRWKSKTSFLSEESKKIHDNNYYQEYSYDISSIIDPKKYTGLISDVVGVAGTKLFSTPLINSDNVIDTTLDAEFVYYNIESQNFIATNGVSEFEYVTQNSVTYPGVNASGVTYAPSTLLFDQNTIAVLTSFDYVPQVGDFVQMTGGGTDVANNPSNFIAPNTTYQVKTVGSIQGTAPFAYRSVTLHVVGDSGLDITIPTITYNAAATDPLYSTNGLVVTFRSDNVVTQNLVADIAIETGVS